MEFKDLREDFECFVADNCISDKFLAYIKTNISSYEGVLYRGSGHFDGELVPGNIIEVGKNRFCSSWTKDINIGIQFIDDKPNEFYLDGINCQIYKAENWSGVLFEVVNPTTTIDVHSIITKNKWAKKYQQEQEVLIVETKFKVIDVADVERTNYNRELNKPTINKYKKVKVEALNTYDVRKQIEANMPNKKVYYDRLYSKNSMDKDGIVTFVGGENIYKPLAGLNICKTLDLGEVFIIKGNEELLLNTI